jgi:hypothetical protein
MTQIDADMKNAFEQEQTEATEFGVKEASQIAF